jgi:hypothetical protein
MSENNKKIEDQIIQATLGAIQKKYPYILDIMDEVKKTGNGVVDLSIRVYNGSVTDLVFTNVTRKVYKPSTK